MTGFDPFSEPSLLKVSNAMEQATTTTQVINKILVSSNGSTYFFGVSGVVYVRSALGVYTSLAAPSPAAGANTILDAYEHNGYIYYAMEQRLGKWNVTTAWGTRDDNFGTFGVGNTTYHPMYAKFRVLHIGDGSQIAQVDETGTFVANALDLDDSYTITCLAETQTELAIGTTMNSTTGTSKMFMWNTYSLNVTSEYLVPEPIIHALFYVGNTLVCNAGYQGSFYQLSGYRMQKFKQLTGPWDLITARCKVYPNSVTYIGGVAHFAVSAYAGSHPVPTGVYALGSRDSEFPSILAMPYVLSTGTDDVNIPALANLNGGTLVASWKNNNGSTTGVDEMTTNRTQSMRLTTGIISLDRENLKTFRVQLFYRQYDTDWTFLLQATRDAIVSPLFVSKIEYDGIHRCIMWEEDITDAATLSLDLSVLTSTASTVGIEIESLQIDVY